MEKALNINRVFPVVNKLKSAVLRNERSGLYDPRNEHDACGLGFIANIKGKKTHKIM